MRFCELEQHYKIVSIRTLLIYMQYPNPGLTAGPSLPKVPQHHYLHQVP